MKSAKEFLEFVEGIPEDKWCTGQLSCGESRCMLGHLGDGKDHPKEGTEAYEKVEALAQIMRKVLLENKIEHVGWHDVRSDRNHIGLIWGWNDQSSGEISSRIVGFWRNLFGRIGVKERWVKLLKKGIEIEGYEERRSMAIARGSTRS